MLAINIPADGLFLAILNKAQGDLSAENSLRILRNYIGRILDTKPDVILLNVCYRRSLTPSQVFDSYLYDVETDENGLARRTDSGETIRTLSPVSDQVSKYFASFFTCARVLMQNGVDIYQTAVRQIREAGCRVYLSVRMNDGHYTDHPAVNSPFAIKNGGEHTIGHDGVALDFSQTAVQNHICEYIEELLSRYPADGVELDWLRYPNVLPREHCSDFSILNGYMRRVRALLNRFDPNLSLAVRVLPSEQDDLQHGMDVCQWVADGSADMVTIENFYVPTNFEMPVAQWKESLRQRDPAGHPCLLFCGTDWAVSCVQKYSLAMNPALVRGFAADCLHRGADGIYLFNFFEEDDTSAFEFVQDKTGARLVNCFVSRIQAAREPDKLPRRYVHIGCTNERYPICLEPGQEYEFVRQIHSSSCAGSVVIGSDIDAPLSVRINGLDASVPLQGESVHPGFAFIPQDQIGRDNEFIYAVSQAAPCVRTVAIPAQAMAASAAKITIRNESSQNILLLWLEFRCD